MNASPKVPQLLFLATFSRLSLGNGQKRYINWYRDGVYLEAVSCNGEFIPNIGLSRIITSLSPEFLIGFLEVTSHNLSIEYVGNGYFFAVTRLLLDARWKLYEREVQLCICAQWPWWYLTCRQSPAYERHGSRLWFTPVNWRLPVACALLFIALL